MYAIVRQRDGSYYTSVVFGYFWYVTAKDEYERYRESIHNRFYIVLNSEKTGLIVQPVFERENIHLDPLIIVTDQSQDDWITDDNGCGCVNFLDTESLLRDVREGTVSSADTEKCIDKDSEYVYSEYVCVDSQAGLDDLYCAAGGFHDAYVKDFKNLSDDEVYILLDGIWGCSVEIWFKEEADYNFDTDVIDDTAAYWFGATFTLFDGFYYLINEEDTSPDNIPKGYTWFKGRQLKYRIIPDSKYNFKHG